MPNDRNAENISKTTLKRIYRKINLRLDSKLANTPEGYDDSVVGINEAWNIVREILEKEIANA